MKSIIVAATAVVVIGAGAARADLPALQVQTGVGYVDYSAGAVLTDSISVFGSVTDGSSVAAAASLPGGSVFASAPVNTNIASASLTYSAEVVGPTDEVVPVGLYYRLFVKNLATGYYHNASAEAYIAGADAHEYTGNYSPDTYWSCSDSCVTPGYLTTSVTTNTPFEISIFVAGVGAEAYADPKLVIDPTWAATHRANASQLSLSFSDGIDNALGNFTLGVPEPAAWSLMITGLFGVGAVARRRPKPATV
jgi:hypothetical protein